MSTTPKTNFASKPRQHNPSQKTRKRTAVKKDSKKASSQLNKIAAKAKKIPYKAMILRNAPYIIVFYICNKLAWLYQYAQSSTALGKVVTTLTYASLAFKNPLPSFALKPLLFGIIAALLLRAAVYLKMQNAKKFRKGREYGSARWGTPEESKRFEAEKFEDNILLSKTERISYRGNMANWKDNRNRNVLVVGGSGSGKTRGYVKPNLMQMHCSYVLTDPKGTVLKECGKMLLENGYSVKVLNTINFSESMHYNPFAYLSSEDSILKLVDAIINNTKGEGDKNSGDFWEKAERLLYTALIAFIHYEAPLEEQNFNTLTAMISACETREEDESYKNAIDYLFENLEQESPDHFAVRQYAKYKLAAGKTAKSILISCGARLAPFDIQQVRDTMSYDEMDLLDLGKKKTALFVLTSDTSSTFNFIAAIMYTQMFNLLCEFADSQPDGKLPISVRCILDEFSNIGKIPGFEILIATIRSREISASIILQTKSQLKAIYKDHAETITGNCDSHIFLGGQEKTTLKDFSEMFGKETIDIINTSENKGSQQSSGMNHQKLGRELMTQDEMAVLDGGQCLVQIRGVRPFKSEKFDICKHPKYNQLFDYSKKNYFDVKKYLKSNLVVKKDDVYENYVVELSA